MSVYRPVVIQYPLGPCDCLNYCGDDQRVAQGSVRECDRHRERRLQDGRAARIAQILRETGHDNVLPALEQLLRLVKGQPRTDTTPQP